MRFLAIKSFNRECPGCKFLAWRRKIKWLCRIGLAIFSPTLSIPRADEVTNSTDWREIDHHVRRHLVHIEGMFVHIASSVITIIIHHMKVAQSSTFDLQSSTQELGFTRSKAFLLLIPAFEKGALSQSEIHIYGFFPILTDHLQSEAPSQHERSFILVHVMSSHHRSAAWISQFPSLGTISVHYLTLAY